MNIKQEGLGYCTQCNNPIMGTINQPGSKGVCFACKAAGEPKTGKTVIVKSETGDMGNSAGIAPNGKVEIQVVDSTVLTGQLEKKTLVETKISSNELTLVVSIDDLREFGIVTVLLQTAYDAIDGMPPPPTIKEQKKVIKLQDDIEVLLKQREVKEN